MDNGPKYEYQYVIFDKDIESGVERLNELGQDGWKVLQIVVPFHSVIVFLMREWYVQ